MKKEVRKKMRRDTKRFCCALLSNMGFKDRVRFVFTGNYLEPLRSTLKSMKDVEESTNER